MRGPRRNDRGHLRLHDPREARELFWQNVVRELLTTLAMQRSRLAAVAEAHRREAVAAGGEDPGPVRNLPGFDGRVAVVTEGGDRIPIAEIIPLFACSIGGTSRSRALSEDVQCSVFQIRTPTGEIYTFPVHEIRGVHALTEEAMRSLKEESSAKDGDGVPFGFAAFTSLAQELDEPEREGEPEDESEPE